MDRKLMTSIEGALGSRIPIHLGRSCALLAALLLTACGGDSKTSTDARKDVGADSPGNRDTRVVDSPVADVSDAPIRQDGPAGCSVGGQLYAVGQSIVVPGNCPTTCVCLTGGALGNCFSNCPSDAGTPPDAPPGDGPRATTCSWAGTTYAPGQKLPLNDGCGGYCVCLADGTVGACTEACPIDGGADAPRDTVKRDAPVDQPPPVDGGCANGAACTLANGDRGYCSAAGVCSACSGNQADTRCATAYGSGYVCVSGECVSGCNNSGQCTGGRLCNTTTHACVACNVATSDAGDPVAAADNRCQADTTYGGTTICLNGACTTGDCHNSADCNAGRVCGASVPNACGDCSTDQQCRQDTRYGTGHICVGNLCVQGNCHTTTDCTTAGQVCNTTTHTCGTCTSDTQCAAEYTNRPICVTTTGLTSTGLCVANTNLCTTNNVTCPRNSSDFCCGGQCVPGNCCVTADCTAIDPDYVCQGHTCTHCDAVTGNSYFVDPVNGDDVRANGSGRAGGAASAGCAFKTLTQALTTVGTPTAATTITIVGPSTMGAATTLNAETLPFAVPARVTITTQGGAVTLSLRSGENGFRFIGGANAASALSPATGAAFTIDRASATAVPGYGIHLEPTGTGTVTVSNVTVSRGGGGTANAAIELAGGTVVVSNVTISNAAKSGIRISGGTSTLSNVTVGSASTNGAGTNGIEVAGGTVTINQGVQVAYAAQNGFAISGGTVTINNGTATNTATRFDNNGGAGIAVSGTGVLDLTGAISGTSRSVTTQSNNGNNVEFASTSTTASSINGLYSFGSDADGLLITAGSRLTVRNSTFLGNADNGVHIVTSGAGADDVVEGRIDLGTGTATTGNVRGHNTLQVAASPTAANQNGGAGLCIGALTAGAGDQTLSAQANLFAGATTGTRDCVTTTPGELTVSATCAGGVDLGILAQPTNVSVTVETDNCTQP